MGRITHILICFLLVLSTLVVPVYADDYEPSDEPTNSTNEFILDADNTGGDVTIQFGGVLNESLKYDAVDLRFELSDPLSLEGNELEDFRIENAGSDPEACAGPISGRMYYNTGSNELQVCDGTDWVAVGSGSGGGDQTNVVYVDATRTGQVGEVYDTLANAIIYINAQIPGSGNRWVMILEPGTNTESVTIPTFTALVGRDRQTTILTGTITMSASSALQGVTVNGGGEVDIANTVTAYVSDSDVNLDDGASGGIDGTLVIHDSFVDGEIAATGAIMAYNSVIGPTGLTNDGTLATYHSTVLTLTNNSIWNNFGTAYNNGVLGAADRLDATNIQSAFDELVLGTPADNFTLDENQGGAQDVTLTFGNVVSETLQWDNANDYFVLSDALVVDGNVNIQDTTLRLDSDNTAGSGVDLDIVAVQGTDNDGTLRYSASNNRWEISNDGGSFEAITTGSGIVTTDLAAVQARESSTFNLSVGSFADVSFDTTDIENDSAVVEHNSADQITAKEDGIYQISYEVSLLTPTTTIYPNITGRVRIDDTTVVNGSIATTGIIRFDATINQDMHLSKSFIVSLTANEVLTLQLQTDTGTTTAAADATFTVIKMEGIEGPQGATGPSGGGASNLDDAYDDGGSGLGRQITVDSGAFDLQGTGEVVELGTGSAADVFLNFDDGVDRQLGWDDSLTSFSTFDQQLSFRVVQSAAPPVACSSTVTGMQWFDTDTGITYVCDTSNSRNKWLSIGEFNITGGESASCAAGASTGDGCTQDIHNGTDANDLGWQMIRDATIVAGSFHSDASCTDGAGVALEVREGDNGTLNLLGNVLTGCTDANGCSSTGVNIDVDADQIIRGVLNNSCVSGSVTDWSNIFVVRWRHD